MTYLNFLLPPLSNKSLINIYLKEKLILHFIIYLKSGRKIVESNALFITLCHFFKLFFYQQRLPESRTTRHWLRIRQSGRFKV